MEKNVNFAKVLEEIRLNELGKDVDVSPTNVVAKSEVEQKAEEFISEWLLPKFVEIVIHDPSRSSYIINISTRVGSRGAIIECSHTWGENTSARGPLDYKKIISVSVIDKVYELAPKHGIKTNQDYPGCMKRYSFQIYFDDSNTVSTADEIAINKLDPQDVIWNEYFNPAFEWFRKKLKSTPNIPFRVYSCTSDLCYILFGRGTFGWSKWVMVPYGKDIILKALEGFCKYGYKFRKLDSSAYSKNSFGFLADLNK